MKNYVPKLYKSVLTITLVLNSSLYSRDEETPVKELAQLTEKPCTVDTERQGPLLNNKNYSSPVMSPRHQAIHLKETTAPTPLNKTKGSLKSEISLSSIQPPAAISKSKSSQKLAITESLEKPSLDTHSSCSSHTIKAIEVLNDDNQKIMTQETVNSPKQIMPPATSIKNSINIKSLTYEKNWHKPSPTTCSVHVDNKEIVTIEKNKQLFAQDIQIEHGKKTITASYHWKIEKLGKVWHEEKKEVTFDLEDDKLEQQRTLSFNWETPERLELSHAKIVSCKPL